MQVDQRQTGRALIDRQMQQKVADVEIAMIDAAAALNVSLALDPTAA